MSIAPAIRDGLVRVSGIDPKGMELAYGRRIFHRYAVTSKDALALLDDLVDGMEARKAEFAGRVRVVPITRDHPLELLEFDEIGALLRYVGDRKTREAIIDRVALLTTQGRALGYTVRGYVQEPTKDTVPVRELFPRRICLRVATKSARGDGARRPRLRPRRLGQPDRRVRGRGRLPVRRGHPRTPARPGRLGRRRHDQGAGGVRHRLTRAARHGPGPSPPDAGAVADRGCGMSRQDRQLFAGSARSGSPELTFINAGSARSAGSD